ncbi:MAG: aconitase family protein, partial [Phycisphaerae bacterium]|nr:aconitase family protein [Phycisphaerae bacterium]
AEPGAGYDRITKRLHVQRDAAVLERIRQYCTDVDVGKADASGMAAVSFGRVVIDLSQLEPLAAAPSTPDNVVPVAQIAGKPVSQVAIGSCTNSSYQDLMLVAGALAGRTVHPEVELAIAPGSRQVLTMLAANGALADLVRAGVRILEAACGPCIGLGFAPGEGTVSLRSFNRNFPGRSGTVGDQVYLVSPESAVAAAITGKITDPRTLTEGFGVAYKAVDPPRAFVIDDGMISPPLPADQADAVEVVRGSTLVKPPAGQALGDTLTALVLIKVGDQVSTDQITPAGELLKYRSNVPEYAKSVFRGLTRPGEPTFAERALAARGAGKVGVIVAGDSYGQGSSREHAALCPMVLGVGVVIAKAVERIHQANLVNFGILPLVFADPADYDRVDQGDELRIDGLSRTIASQPAVTVRNATKKREFTCQVPLAPRQRKVLAAGGLLPYTRQGGR